MRATVTLPPSIALIEAFLDGLVQANMLLIEAGQVPSSPLNAGVRYQREPSGFEEWNIALLVKEMGWGDCEDLNAWAVAGLRVSGEDPSARVVLIRTGSHLFHCVGLLSNGDIYDVCPSLGMKVPSRHPLPGRKSP